MDLEPLPPIVPAGPQIAATVRIAAITPDGQGPGQGGGGTRPRRRSAPPRPRPVAPPAGELTDAFADEVVDDADDGHPHVDVRA